MNDVLRRIIAMLMDKGEKPSDLCRGTGISKSTFSTWKKKGTVPPTKWLKVIAEYLGTTTDYLITGDKEGGYYVNKAVAEKIQEAYDDPNIRMIIDATRDLSEEDLQMILAMIKRFKKG